MFGFGFASILGLPAKWPRDLDGCTFIASPSPGRDLLSVLGEGVLLSSSSLLHLCLPLLSSLYILECRAWIRCEITSETWGEEGLVFVHVLNFPVLTPKSIVGFV